MTQCLLSVVIPNSKIELAASVHLPLTNDSNPSLIYRHIIVYCHHMAQCGGVTYYCLSLLSMSANVR